ncbi:MAG: tetratricopeptide repeat protein [Opitutales bacterium]
MPCKHISAPRKWQSSRCTAGLLVFAMLAPFILLAQNPYWNEFGNKPVFIEQNNSGNRQMLKFVAYRDNMLVAEMKLNNPDGSTSIAEIAQPVSESMVRTLNFQIKALRKAYQLIDGGNHIGAVKLLRPQVYPLVKFHQVPESFIQLHQPVRLLIDSLIKAGELAEAEDLLNRIALEKVDLQYSENAQALLLAYQQQEDFDSLARVAGTLPVSGAYAGNIRPLINAADALRGAGYYDAVVPLYRAIQSVVDPSVKKNIDLWLAYSLVLANQLEEANILIEGIAEPQPGDSLFSLYKLLHGSRLHRMERYGEALDTLTRGFVRAQTSYSWVPEMLYLIGDCYLRAEDPVAAKSVWLEVVALYPRSPWAGRTNEALKALPKPENTP